MEFCKFNWFRWATVKNGWHHFYFQNKWFTLAMRRNMTTSLGERSHLTEFYLFFFKDIIETRFNRDNANLWRCRTIGMHIQGNGNHPVTWKTSEYGICVGRRSGNGRSVAVRCDFGRDSQIRRFDDNTRTLLGGGARNIWTVGTRLAR